MDLAAQFADAQVRVKNVPHALPPETLLELYSLFKQATVGDVTGARPGMLDFKGRAKWDAWATRRGLPREQAMELYVAAVDRVAPR